MTTIGEGPQDQPGGRAAEPKKQKRFQIIETFQALDQMELRRQKRAYVLLVISAVFMIVVGGLGFAIIFLTRDLIDDGTYVGIVTIISVVTGLVGAAASANFAASKNQRMARSLYETAVEHLQKELVDSWRDLDSYEERVRKLERSPNVQTYPSLQKDAADDH